jgi:hypothetical protein
MDGRGTGVGKGKSAAAGRYKEKLLNMPRKRVPFHLRPNKESSPYMRRGFGEFPH